MKKDNFNRNDYNKKLLIFLVALTVIICVAFAAIAVVLSDKGEDAKGNNPPADVSVEEKNEAQKEETPEPVPEQPEVVPESKEEENSESVPEQPEVTEEPAEPEIPEVPVAEQQNSDWNLILANPWNKLPEDFTVELFDIGSGHKVDARIVDDLNQMMSDLRSAGLSAFVCSSYRSNQKQTNLYKNEVNEYIANGYSDEDAAVEAAKWVAIPGTSEHQTGLAVDIMSSHYLVLDKGQEDTAEQQWLMANSYKYGFILRYPNDKSEITGIYYEPWHYRYVGKDAAKEIYEKGICFEEYLLL